MLSFVPKMKSKLNREKIASAKEQFMWIYGYAKPQIGLIVVYTLLGFSGVVVSLITSLVSRDLVDIITGHKTGTLIFTFVSMLLVTIFSTAIGQISNYMSNKISLRIENYIKTDVFKYIMNAEWTELEKYHSGDLIVRWNGDSAVISNGILTLLPNFCIYLFQFIAALYMVCRYDASFAIFALVSAPVSMLISRETLKMMQKNNMNMMSINGNITSFNQEAFGNIQLLKAFDMIPVYTKKMQELQKEYVRVRLKYQKTTIINALILTTLSMLVSFAAQGWGIYKVWSGAITYGTMTMFITLSGSLTGALNRFISLIPNSISLFNASKRLRQVSDLPKEDFQEKDAVADFYRKHEKDGIGIHMKDMSFSYVEDAEIFVHSEFDACPRETVAIVGPSGEGKTTLLRLLLSLLHTQSGEAYISAGDNETEKYNISASIRQLISYVPQGNTMFSGTIADNMRNVKENATDEEIVEALKKACAWGFVEKLSDGIYTELREHGGGLSEGQAQRLSIARALIRNSPILLLDEATSALDIETERNVLRNILEDQYARTCIVSTHRPSILNVCNRVYSITDKRCRVLSKTEIEKMISDFV